MCLWRLLNVFQYMFRLLNVYHKFMEHFHRGTDSVLPQIMLWGTMANSFVLEGSYIFPLSLTCCNILGHDATHTDEWKQHSVHG